MTDLDKEVLYLLSRCEGIGPIKLAKLLSCFETPSELMQLNAKQLFEKTGQKLRQIEPFFQSQWREDRLQERNRVMAAGVKLLYKGEESYPVNLMQAYDAPAALYTLGQPLSEEKKFLSVVGTRAMTAYGKKIIEELLVNLDNNQVVIVSGLAKGVDVYTQSLACEMGFEVVSVVAHGLDITYPRAHLSLRKKMEKQGCTLSEFFHGVKPLAGHFVARNRIIAALSKATFIVESAQSGGSLTTAHFAFDYQRILFAAPGRILDRYSAGCNRLISDLKAQLYTSPESLIEALGLKRFGGNKPQFVEIQFKNTSDKTLYEYLLKNGRAYPSQLLRHLNLEKQEVYSALLSLTLDEAIVHHNDNSYEVL